MILPNNEKIIQIHYGKDRLYILTNKGNVYHKYDNYDGYELIAESKIKEVIKPEFKKSPKIISFLKKIKLIKPVE
jgi:alpha-tubulin suppressor-like RCC1 family protein